MSLNNTPASERIHIGIFGKRNAGKSSVINAITGQNLAIVSDVKGTTTDPVLKAMELLPLGPVVVIDTPGLDDEGELGALRIQKAYQMLNKTDVAILVVDSNVGMTKEDGQILERIKEKEIPYLVVMNKADLLTTDVSDKSKMIYVSAKTGYNIYALKSISGYFKSFNSVSHCFPYFFPIFRWRTMHFFPKPLSIIAETVKSASQRNIADGKIGIYQQFTASLNPILI